MNAILPLLQVIGIHACVSFSHLSCLEFLAGKTSEESTLSRARVSDDNIPSLVDEKCAQVMGNLDATLWSYDAESLRERSAV